MGVEEIACELIALIYDAAMAPEKWRTFMDRLVVVMESRSAMLREVDYTAGNVGLFETVGYDPTYMAAYRDHFVQLDYFAPTFVSMPIGALIIGEQAVPWQEQCKTEFGNDYIRAQNIRHVMGCVLAKNDRYHLQFGLQREREQGDYGAKDQQLIKTLAPHMARAVEINHKISAINTQKHWALSALDRLRVGVILLDELGKPRFLNREAERLTTSAHGFFVGRNGLVLPSATDTTRLHGMIANAARMADGTATNPGALADGDLCIRTTGSDGAGLQFQVIPLPRGLSEQPWEMTSCHGCVAVFISVAGGPRLSWNRIMVLYGLTRAEAKLASALANGTSLEESAVALSISIHTARSQLKSVFAKTGVTRQAELVAILLADMLNDQAGRL